MSARSLKVLEKRFLRGPNLHSASPCLMFLLEGAPAMSGDIRGTLLALLPALSAPSGAQVDGTLLLEWVDPVVMELQRLAGAPGPFSRTLPVPARPWARRVVCSYAIEQVAGAALAAALDLLDALARGEEHEIDEAIAELRDTAEDHAIGTSTAAVLAAAQRRGIPSVRLRTTPTCSSSAGARSQKRMQATITGATSSIAVSIASDKQLTKTLLDAGRRAGARRRARHARVEEAQRVGARACDGPVTVKPLDGNQGKGVTTDCADPGRSRRAPSSSRAEYGRQRHRRALPRRARLPRAGHRQTKVAAASWRRPPHVVGDGISTVRELVERENAEPGARRGPRQRPDQDPARRHAPPTVLAQAGLSTSDSVPAGRRDASNCAATPTSPPAAPPRT